MLGWVSKFLRTCIVPESYLRRTKFGKASAVRWLFGENGVLFGGASVNARVMAEQQGSIYRAKCEVGTMLVRTATVVLPKVDRSLDG